MDGTSGQSIARVLKRAAKRALHGGLPVPLFVRPMVWVLYRMGIAVAELLRLAYAWFIAGPVVRSVASVGQGLRIERVPYIRGNGEITIGSGVYISGKIGISFSRHACKTPKFQLGDRTFVGHGCSFSAAGKIAVGNDCLIGGNVRIQDNDAHPLDPDLRRKGEPVNDQDVHPVVIEDGAWIAPRCTILKGVTIGENSVVGADSVVTKDVPANMLVAGNPARIIRKLVCRDPVDYAISSTPDPSFSGDLSLTRGCSAQPSQRV